MRRRLLFTFLILFVAMIALAFYRHWLFLSVHSPQEGQTQLSVTFDQWKFSDDFASFTGRQ